MMLRKSGKYFIKTLQSTEIPAIHVPTAND